MTTPARPPAALVRTAADLRAAGNAWERIAGEVNRPLADVRAWPQQYPAVWRKALVAAERRTLAEATAEAVTQLRKLLRSDEPKVICDAGMKLVQIRALMERTRRRPATAKQPTSPPGYADRLLALVRGMTDEQLAATVLEGGG